MQVSFISETEITIGRKLCQGISRSEKVLASGNSYVLGFRSVNRDMLTATEGAALIGRSNRRFNQLVEDRCFTAKDHVAGVPLYARADIENYLQKTSDATGRGKYRRNGKKAKKK